MNIHFTDKDLKEQLDKSTIFEIEVGSGMYGLKHQNRIQIFLKFI